MSALNQVQSAMTVASDGLATLTEGTTKPEAKSKRIPALDFTKGSLVLIMVLYHWLNYFYAGQAKWDVFRYLRFLTPSFIFITGFLVSNIYFAKYGIASRRLPARLAERGLKLLGVFAVLNIFRTLLLPRGARLQLISEHLSLRSLVNIYVIGTDLGGGQGKAVAFYILVPIGYLLILAALLLIGAKRWRPLFYWVFGVCLLGLSILDFAHLNSANLQLLTIGLLGLLLGYVPIGRISRFVDHPWIVIAAYACYLGAITIWNVIYLLQIVGVCLSLMLIYMVGSSQALRGMTQNQVILLGQYSLLGYIAQIAVLQILYQAFRHSDMSVRAVQWISFVSAVLLTILIVRATNSLRRVRMVDGFYRAIFG